MDYSKLSDFEINKRVLKIKSGIKPLGYAHNADERSAGIVDVSKNYHWYDFCNNPADAWPIIVGNAIGLMPFKKGESEAWSLSAGLLSNTAVKHENLLRAAMIVYLMMQDESNEK